MRPIRPGSSVSTRQLLNYGKPVFACPSPSSPRSTKSKLADPAIFMYTRGVTCFSCHDVHGTDNDALLWKPANVLCLDCHGPNSPNGPHAPTIEQHTHHKVGSQGSECIACHMPKIQQTIVDVNVRSHTFHFVTQIGRASCRERV